MITQFISVEWIKLRNQKSLWIALGLFAVMIWSGAFIWVTVAGLGGQAIPFLQKVVGFPIAWFIIPSIASFLTFLPGLIIVNNIGTEFNHKIIRQHLSDGMTRDSYFMSKVVLGVFVSLACTIIVAVLVLYFGIVNSTDSFIKGDDVSKFIGKYGFVAKLLISPMTLVMYFIQAFGYMMFASVFAMFMRGHGMASVFYLFYLLLIENLISWIITLTTRSDLGALLPMHSIYSFFDYSKLFLYFAKDQVENLNGMSKDLNINTNLLIGYKGAVISALLWIAGLTFFFRHKVKTSDF